METKNEAATKEVAKDEKPKTIEQQLNEKAERKRKEAIAKNKELEEQRKLEEKKAQEEQKRQLRQKKELEQAGFQHVFEKHLKEFEPKQIGEPDTRLKFKIENYYDNFCNLLNKASTELAEYLRIEEKLPVNQLFEFIKNDPDEWLPKEYITVNQIEVPANLNITQVIKLELVDLPETGNLPALHTDIQKAWQNIQSEGFIFSLKELYIEEENQFRISIEFFEAEDEYLAIKTTTAEQNVIVDILENLLESLYDLSALQIIKLEKGPAELDRINSFLLFKGGGVTLNPRIFKRHPALKQYFERPARNGQSVTLDQLLQ